MSATAAIRQAIINAIASINGVVGGYTHDFSQGPGQVASGRYTAPPGRALPFACVYTVAVRESTGGVPTDQVGESGSFLVTAWARASAADRDHRLDVADTLLDDLRTALRKAPGLGLSYVVGHTMDWVPTETDVASDYAGPDKRNYAIVIGVINVTWRDTRPGV